MIKIITFILIFVHPFFCRTFLQEPFSHENALTFHRKDKIRMGNRNLLSSKQLKNSRLLLYLISLSDQDHPNTVLEMQNSNFAFDLNRFYLQSSYEQQGFSTDFVAVSVAESTKDYTKNPLVFLFMNTPKSADKKAQEQGINISSYEWKAYSYPYNPTFTSSSFTTIGGRKIILQTTPPKWNDLSHEIGHGLNLYHASSLLCDQPILVVNATNLKNCKRQEYGDPIEVMARYLPGDFNPYYKKKAGWTDGPNQPKTQNITKSGTYLIGELSSLTQDVKGLFLKRSDSDNDFNQSKTFYSIEYRNANWDPQVFEDLSKITGIAQSCAIQSKGVLIKIINEQNQHSYVIPTNKAFGVTSSPVPSAIRSYGLQTGETFTDQTIGFTLKVKKINTKNAQIIITLKP